MAEVRDGPELFTCQEMVALITDYLERAMPPADRMRFEEHLAICDGCTNFLQEIRRTVELTGALREEQIPVDMKQKLLAVFRDWNRKRSARPEESG